MSTSTYDDALPNGTSPESVGAIIGNYQSVATQQINRLRRTPAFQNVRAYIGTNPQN